MNLISKSISLSKTAINGLVFFKKEEENNLIKKDQHEKIIDVFRFFFILLNEKYDHLETNGIIQEFMLKIMPQRNCENLSTF